MELKSILQILFRRKWIIISGFAAVFLTIVGLSLIVTPWHDATAKVLLRKSSATSSLFATVGVQGSSTTTTLSDTDRADYLALSTVRPVLDKVVSELDVRRTKTRARILRAVPFLKPVLAFIGVDVAKTEEKMNTEDITDWSVLNYLFPIPNVSVEQYESTDILDITAVSPNPQQAADIANALAKAFNEEERNRIREDFVGAREFIAENIGKSKQEYTKALAALSDFKEREKSINLDTQTTNLLQRIIDLKRGMDDNNLAIYKTRAAMEKAMSQLATMPKFQKDSEQIKANDTVISLKQTLVGLYISLAETKTKYTKSHPAVIDIENKIAETKNLIKNEMEKVFYTETISVDSSYRSVADKLASNYTDMAGYESMNAAYPKVISAYETELLRLPKKVYQYAQLDLAVSVTQNIYETLLKYMYQMGFAESITLSNIYIVEPAKAPDANDDRHISPDLKVNTAIAILLGLSFGILAAFLMEYMDDTLKSSDDIKAFKGFTFLGSIIRLKPRDIKLISQIDPKSSLNEAFRTIRNSMRFANLERPIKSFTVTSSSQGEGKSFFSTNIGISLASEGKKVLIIDGDLRRPSIHNYFSKPNTLGLTNYLIGEASVDKVQIPSGVAGVTIIPTGPIPPDPARLVESKKMRDVVKEMVNAYDSVIIDSPPFLVASDALLLGAETDGTIIVVESGRANRQHISDMLDFMKKANLNVIGAALNKVRVGGLSYYYYYSPYYKTD